MEMKIAMVWRPFDFGAAYPELEQQNPEPRTRPERGRASRRAYQVRHVQPATTSLRMRRVKG